MGLAQGQRRVVRNLPQVLADMLQPRAQPPVVWRLVADCLKRNMGKIVREQHMYTHMAGMFAGRMVDTLRTGMQTPGYSGGNMFLSLYK